MSDFYKRFLHHGKRPSLYYLRTRDGLKADLVADLDGRLHLLEVKSAKTIFPGHWQGLNRWRSQLAAKAGQAVLLSRAESLVKPLDGVWRLPWQSLTV